MNVISIRCMIAILAMCLTTSVMAQSKKHLEVGDAVPMFSLTDQDGKVFNIKDHIGKHKLVIFFYPKDQSMVCTKEACQFRDSFKDFSDAGAIVVGINNGTVASHKAFAEADKLPYKLLSDPDNKVLNMFGVKGKLFMTGRETFVIGLDGKVAYQYAGMMEGKAHADNTLQFVKGVKK